MANRVFPDSETWDENDFIGATEDFDERLMLAGYREGLFAMPLQTDWGIPGVGWWSPLERGVLRPDSIRITKSLKRSMRKYRVTTNQAFAEVLVGCADESRENGWIDDAFQNNYLKLHDEGLAISIETWDDDVLVGGLFGITLGGLFVGESMFHTARDASKVALAHLAQTLTDNKPRLIDTQWLTPHLASLGVTAITRAEYLRILPILLDSSGPIWPRPLRVP